VGGGGGGGGGGGVWGGGRGSFQQEITNFEPYVMGTWPNEHMTCMNTGSQWSLKDVATEKKRRI